MTEIQIKENGKVEEITVIDPKTGLDWAADLIGNTDPVIVGFNSDDNMIMGQEEFDWWSDYCEKYEQADNLVHDFFNDLEENCWNNFETGHPEDAYQKSIELSEEYHNYICGIEFNDLPSAMVNFVVGRWNK